MSEITELLNKGKFLPMVYKLIIETCKQMQTDWPTQSVEERERVELFADLQAQYIQEVVEGRLDVHHA